MLSLTALITFVAFLQADITAMVAKKVAGRKAASSIQLELNRRRAEHTMAIKRQDYDAAEAIADIIRALDEDLAVQAALAPTSSAPAVEDYGTILNEKNKRAQIEAIKKSDADKKEARRLAALAGDNPSKRFKALGLSFVRYELACRFKIHPKPVLIACS